MRLIGLSGGIATGKSTVANEIVDAGYPLIDCDKIAKDVVRKGRWGHRRVVAAFGEEILLPDGELDRPALGQLVFNNPELRKRLNKATHTPVFCELFRQLFMQWLLFKPAVVIDMPLLFETGFQRWTAFTILVSCSTECQLERLMKRDVSTKEQALSRIRSQMPLDKKAKLADEVVDNNRSREDAAKQAKDILQRRAKPSILHSLLLSPLGILATAGGITSLVRRYL